jgi:hypothetical protein
MYFIAATDSNGENQDQFVCAHDTEEAKRLFLENMELSEEQIAEEFDAFRIFEAPTDISTIGVIGWDELPVTTVK